MSAIWKKEVQYPRKLATLIPLLFGVFWIVGFYTPAVATFIYSTRWEASVLIFAISAMVILSRGSSRLDSITLMICFLLMLLFISTLYSFAPTYTILRSISATVLIASTFILCNATIRNTEDLRRLIWVFLIMNVMLLMSFYYSVLTDEYAFASDRLQANRQFKATGGGNMLVSAGLLGIWVLKYCNRSLRVFVVSGLAVIAISIVMTRSRVPLAGLALTWPAALVMFYGGKLNKSVIATLIISFSAGIYVYTSPESAQYVRLDEQALEERGYDITTGRFERWEFLYNLGLQKPSFGHGFGTSRYAKWRWTHIQDSYLEWTEEINNTNTQQLAHNQHVQMFFEVGIFGLIVFWLCLFLILAAGVRVTRLPNTPESFFLKMMLLSICFHILDTFSHDGLLSPGQPASYLFWMKAGVLVYGARVLVRNRRKSRTRHNSQLVTSTQIPQGA